MPDREIETCRDLLTGKPSIPEFVVRPESDL